MKESTFKKQTEDTKFKKDLKNFVRLNDGYISWGKYNLIISIRDVSLFCRGIKPHRNYRFNNVKWYFGVTGSKEKVLWELKQYLIIVENMSASSTDKDLTI